MNYEIIIGKCLEAYADHNYGLMDEDLKKMLNANARHLTSKFDKRQSNNLNNQIFHGQLQQGLGLNFDFAEVTGSSEASNDSSRTERPTNELRNVNMQPNVPARDIACNVSTICPTMETQFSEPLIPTATGNYVSLPAQSTPCGIQKSSIPFCQPENTDWFQDPYAFSHSYLQHATAIQQESSNNQQEPNLWSDPSSGLGSFEQVSGLNDNPIMAPVARSLFGLQTSHT